MKTEPNDIKCPACKFGILELHAVPALEKGQSLVYSCDTIGCWFRCNEEDLTEICNTQIAQRVHRYRIEYQERDSQGYMQPRIAYREDLDQLPKDFTGIRLESVEVLETFSKGKLEAVRKKSDLLRKLNSTRQALEVSMTNANKHKQVLDELEADLDKIQKELDKADE